MSVVLEIQEEVQVAPGQLELLLLVGHRLFGVGRTSPGTLIRWNDPEHDLTDLDLLTFTNDAKHHAPETVIELDGLLYVGFQRGLNVGADYGLVISEIDPDTLSSTDVVDDTFTGETHSFGCAMAYLDGFMYAVSNGLDDSVVKKYDVSDWSLAGSLTLTGLTLAHAMNTDGTNIYITGRDSTTGIGWFARVTPALTYSSIDFDVGYSTPTNCMGIADGYAWVAFEDGSNKGDSARIDLADLSVDYIDAGITDLGEGAMISDGHWWYVIASSAQAHSHVVKVDRSDLSVETFELPASWDGQFANQIARGRAGFAYVGTIEGDTRILRALVSRDRHPVLITESLILATGENALVAALLLDGELFISGSNAGRILRFNDPANDLTDYDTALLPTSGVSPHNRPSILSYHAGNDRIYTSPNSSAVADGSGNARIVIDEINPADLSSANVVDDSTAYTGLDAAEAFRCEAIVLDDDLWVIVSGAGAAGRDTLLVQYDVSDWSRDSMTTLTGLHAARYIATDGTHLYITGGQTTAAGWIAKVDPADPASYVSANFGANERAPTQITFDGSYLYTGFQAGTDSGKVSRVLKSDLSTTQIPTGLTVYSGSIVVGDRLYVVALTVPGNWVVVNTATLEIVGSGALPSGYNAPQPIAADVEGNLYLGCAIFSPGRVLRLATEAQVALPNALSSAGAWTIQPNLPEGSVDENVSDYDDETAAELDDGPDPSTLVLALNTVSEPTAGDGVLVVRARRID